MRGLARCALLLAGLAGGPTSWACELAARPGADARPVFVVDPRESAIRFEADAGWHDFTGTVGVLSGRVRLDGATPPSEVDACLEIEAPSITTGIARRDETMRRSHLHTDRFPTIRFVLTGAEPVESLGGGRYRVALRGSLTLHGVTRPLSAQAETRLSPAALTVEGDAPLHLSAFAIPLPSFLFVTMKDTVVVRFRITAVRR